VVRMKPHEMEKLEWEVEVVVGMEAMVVNDIATKADLANGTHGEVVGLALDPQEPEHHKDNMGQICLWFPPAVVIFNPSHVSSLVCQKACCQFSLANTHLLSTSKMGTR
jgi:hypothetical protein